MIGQSSARYQLRYRAATSRCTIKLGLTSRKIGLPAPVGLPSIPGPGSTNPPTTSVVRSGILTVVFNDCDDNWGTCTIKSFASGGAILYGSDLIFMSRRSVGLMVTVTNLRSALAVAPALMITPLETVCTAGS